MTELGVRATGLGAAVAFGRATEVDALAPLATLRGLFPVRDFPDLNLEDGGQDHRPLALIRQVGEVIEDRARTRPFLIVLDDAHRADELTALALRMLVPALAGPVLWLLARRAAPANRYAHDALEWLLTKGARREDVGPLTENDVADFCAKSLGAMPDPGLLAVAARAEGNPFLLEEVLRTLWHEGGITFEGGFAAVAHDALTPHIAGAVELRLRDLSEETRRLLDAGAVLGRPFTVHEVAGMLRRSPMELLPAVDEALGAAVLVDDGTELVFRHDLIREALYSRLSSPIRIALHREAAAVVREEGRSAAEMVEHLVRSGRGGETHAVRVLRQAVAQIAPTGPNIAADLILRMLGLLDWHDPDGPQLAATAVRLLAAAGRVDEARELGDSALRAGLAPADEVAVACELAGALQLAGHYAAAVEQVDRALGIPDTDAAIRAELLATRACALLQIDDVPSADHAAETAITLASAIGADGPLICATGVRSDVGVIDGRLDDALAHAREAVWVADRAGGEVRHRHPQLWLASALVAVDRFGEADQVCAMGQREADRLGTVWSQPLWHHRRAEVRLATGRLDDSRAEAEAGLRMAEQFSLRAQEAPLLVVLARLALHDDDKAVARAHLRRARLSPHASGLVLPGLMWTEALLHEADGRAGAAQRVVCELVEAMPARLSLLIADPGAAAQMVRLLRRPGGANGTAETVVAAARRLADRNSAVATYAGAHAHAEGLHRGDRHALRAAVRAYAQGGRPMLTASALEDAARAEEQAGNRHAATALLEQALEQYATCGARRETRRVDKRLRAGAGSRRPRREAGGDPPVGWQSLTPSELRVVRLVAQGLTNREVAARLYLSPHTVDSHLRHSFGKLGITSRVELTRQVMENDGGPLESTRG